MNYQGNDEMESGIRDGWQKNQKQKLENQVNQDVPPTFIWNIYEDKSVPAQNSVLLVEKLLENEIPTEYHLFRRGAHGLSLAFKIYICK